MTLLHDLIEKAKATVSELESAEAAAGNADLLSDAPPVPSEAPPVPPEPPANRYRPATGRQISRYLQAKSMGLENKHPTEADVDAFLASKGVA